MIQIVPTITRKTIRTPNASARTLFVLSGPLVMWRKKTRCTPIWAIARTTSPTATPGPHKARSRRYPEGNARQQQGETETDHISDGLADNAVVRGAWRDVWQVLTLVLAHHSVPIR